MKYFVLMICVVVAIACKSKPRKEIAAIGTAADTTKIMSDSLVKEMESIPPTDSIRLNVSFNSPGYGINGKALKQLEAYIEHFESDNNLKITVYKIPWGREGEVDFCFQLSTIEGKKAEEFVTGVKKLLSTADRVNINENTTCRNLPPR